MNWKRVALRVLLFALFGLLIEVFFTAGGGLIMKQNWNLRGHTSPWMMPVYGLLGVCILPISEPLKRRGIPFLFRAVLYMLLIFLVEYIAGVLFQLLGLSVWDYSNHRLNLHGHITLLYAPFWLFLGLWVEYLHKKVDVCAVAMASGIRGDDLLRCQATREKQ